MSTAKMKEGFFGEGQGLGAGYVVEDAPLVGERPTDWWNMRQGDPRGQAHDSGGQGKKINADVRNK